MPRAMRAESLLERGLEVGALRGPAGTLLGACATGILERFQPLVETAELVAHLRAELVEGTATAGRVEQGGELRAVTVEVTAQQLTEPAEGGVAPSLVEEVAHEAVELARVAEVRLQLARQPPVPIGEVRAQGRLERARGFRLGGRQVAHQAGELGTHDVHVDRRIRVADGEQADRSARSAAPRGPRPAPPPRRRRAPGRGA